MLLPDFAAFRLWSWLQVQIPQKLRVHARLRTLCIGRTGDNDMAKHLLKAAAVVLAMAPVPALADSFTACDGFPAADARSDGLLRMAVAPIAVFAPAADAAGADACTAALTDPRLAPGYRVRRASLTQTRAMHRMAAGNDAAVLADLDAADALVSASGDPYARRSLGVGGQLLRAYLALRRHAMVEAIGLADHVDAERPQALATVLMTARIRMQASGDVDRYLADLRRIAVTYPAVLVRLFGLYGDLRRWDDQIALRARIASVHPSRIGGFEVADAAALAGRQANEEIQLDAQTALALAMTGRDAEARALLDRVDARLAAATGSGVAATRPAATTARQVRQIVAALPLARAGNVAGVAAEGRAGRLPEGPESLSLVELAVARARTPDASLVRTLADLQQRRRRAILEQAIAPADVFAAMPEVETARRVPPYAPLRERSGYVVQPGGTTGRFLIHFAARYGTRAMVQELVLLRAADLARSAGRHGFVVITNRSFSRTINVNDLVSRHVEQAGYAAEAEVMLVDPTRPAANDAERTVDADRVYAELAPVYLGGPPRSAQ